MICWWYVNEIYIYSFRLYSKQKYVMYMICGWYVGDMHMIYQKNVLDYTVYKYKYILCEWSVGDM